MTDGLEWRMTDGLKMNRDRPLRVVARTIRHKLFYSHLPLQNSYQPRLYPLIRARKRGHFYSYRYMYRYERSHLNSHALLLDIFQYFLPEIPQQDPSRCRNSLEKNKSNCAQSPRYSAYKAYSNSLSLNSRYKDALKSSLLQANQQRNGNYGIFSKNHWSQEQQSP
jgi:hypothetical protein